MIMYAKMFLPVYWEMPSQFSATQSVLLQPAALRLVQIPGTTELLTHFATPPWTGGLSSLMYPCRFTSHGDTYVTASIYMYLEHQR